MGADEEPKMPDAIYVLRSLAAHPQDDTVPGIARWSGLSVDQVDATLLDLRHRHLARRWESHWQITTAGLVAATEPAV
jgi:hypothetical protein